jgi:hypothetical protein
VNEDNFSDTLLICQDGVTTKSKLAVSLYIYKKVPAVFPGPEKTAPPNLQNYGFLTIHSIIEKFRYFYAILLLFLLG